MVGKKMAVENRSIALVPSITANYRYLRIVNRVTLENRSETNNVNMGFFIFHQEGDK